VTNYSECDTRLGRPLNQPVAVPLWRQSLNLKEGVTRNPMERPGNLIASPRHDKLLHACKASGSNLQANRIHSRVALP